MSDRLSLPAVAVEIMKAARNRWATQREICEETELSPKTVRSYLEVYEAEGLIKSRNGQRREGFTSGREPVEYSLSTGWGGLSGQ